MWLRGARPGARLRVGEAVTYLCHTVYVVTCAEISTTDAAVREATPADVRNGERLGVLSNGRCVPLSKYEAAVVRERCGQ